MQKRDSVGVVVVVVHSKKRHMALIFLSPVGVASKAPLKAFAPDIIASVTCSPNNSTKLPIAQLRQSTCACAYVNERRPTPKRKMGEILMAF